MCLHLDRGPAVTGIHLELTVLSGLCLPPCQQEGSYLKHMHLPLQLAGYSLQVTDYRLRITGYRLQVTDYRLLGPGYVLKVYLFGSDWIFHQNHHWQKEVPVRAYAFYRLAPNACLPDKQGQPSHACKQDIASPDEEPMRKSYTCGHTSGKCAHTSDLSL